MKVLLILALVGTVVFAQDGANNNSKKCKRSQKPGIEKMAEFLNLTPSQTSQIQAIRDNQMAKREVKMAERKAAREACDQKCSSEEREEKRKEMMAKREANMASVKASIKAILTPEQQVKFELKSAEREQQRKQKCQKNRKNSKKSCK